MYSFTFFVIFTRVHVDPVEKQQRQPVYGHFPGRDVLRRPHVRGICRYLVEHERSTQYELRFLRSGARSWSSYFKEVDPKDANEYEQLNLKVFSGFHGKNVATQSVESTTLKKKKKKLLIRFQQTPTGIINYGCSIVNQLTLKFRLTCKI